jgi:hypothetical protein
MTGPSGQSREVDEKVGLGRPIEELFLSSL